MDIKYSAGFFDGEGSISITYYQPKDGRNAFQLRVQMGNTCLKVLKEFQKMFGGGIITVKKSRDYYIQAYIWYVAAQKAVKFLTEILPYLVVKKSQAELAISFQSILKGNKSSKRLSQKSISFRLDIIEKMKKLKIENLI